MSTRWMKANTWIYKTPDVSPEQRWANMGSHKWETVSLAEKFACASFVGTAEYCSVCGVSRNENLAVWPCEVMQTGWRPERETLLESDNRQRNNLPPNR